MVHFSHQVSVYNLLPDEVFLLRNHQLLLISSESWQDENPKNVDNIYRLRFSNS